MRHKYEAHEKGKPDVTARQCVGEEGKLLLNEFLSQVLKSWIFRQASFHMRQGKLFMQ